MKLRLILGETIGYVRADISQIEQVLMNLVVTARDAMPHGGTVTIMTKLVEDREMDAHFPEMLPAGVYVNLSVSDTGCGMDAETRARIFEPFFTTKEVDKGTGLGLAVAFGIVKQSGGSINGESDVGEGSTFRVYLPQIEQ